MDGEFYFRCCRPDIEPWLDRARSLNLEDPEQAQHFHSILNRLWMDYRLPRQIALDALLHGRKLRLRNHSVSISVGAASREGVLVPVETHVSIDVYSNSLRGKDVAEALIAGYLETGGAYPVAVEANENIMDADLRVTLVDGDAPSAVVRQTLDAGWKWADFVAVSPDDGYFRERKYIGPPHVRVEVKLPLPSADVIAAQYDAAWQQWHDKILKGAAQEPETAMRTWTIALLMATGETLEDALGTWQCLNPESIPISHDRFKKHDRERLFSRVPEARRYLMRRKRPPFGDS